MPINWLRNGSRSTCEGVRRQSHCNPLHVQRMVTVTGQTILPCAEAGCHRLEQVLFIHMYNSVI